MTSTLDGGELQHVVDDTADGLLIAMAATREIEHKVAVNLLAPPEKRRKEKMRAGRKMQRALLRDTLISLQYEFDPAILASFGFEPGAKRSCAWWHTSVRRWRLLHLKDFEQSDVHFMSIWIHSGDSDNGHVKAAHMLGTDACTRDISVLNLV